MLPCFLIIGGMKCGTTSLDHYIKAHSQISMPEKEIDFFSINFNLGVDWYRSKFIRKSPEVRIYGETSVSYAKFPLHADVPKRIHSLLPDVKLIYVVRDPVDRIISHYMHLVYADSEERPLAKIFEKDNFNNLYLDFSLYYMQIEKYLEYFDKNQIMIVSTDDLKEINDRIAALNNIFQFLNVETGINSSKFYEAKQQSAKKGKKRYLAKIISTLPFYDQAVKVSPDFIRDFYVKIFTKKLAPPHISKAFRNRLIEIIQPDTEKLRKFSGRDFKSWCL